MVFRWGGGGNAHSELPGKWSNFGSNSNALPGRPRTLEWTLVFGPFARTSGQINCYLMADASAADPSFFGVGG